jgi:tetratricopeptide (TPR) repeat protein
MGEILNRRGEFDRAIETLQEAVARYPDDERVPRSLYLLGDSYRRSARAIRERLKDVTSSMQADEMRERLTDRMREAQEYFRKLVKEFEKNENARLSRLDEMFVRHAYLYQADCAFDLGDYRKALRLYEEAAGRFQRTITALAAHTQIIHCYVYLGEPAEARSALARARVLVDALPDDAFARNMFGESREDWRRYFVWVQETGLL